MRARALDLQQFVGAAHGVKEGLVGTGDILDPEPEDLDEALELTAAAYGPKAVRMLERFAALPEGTLVWTRTGEDEFRLGSIEGRWRWDGSTAARAVGIHNVRTTRWLDRAFGEDETPRAVVATFERGGKNFQRTNDAEAEQASSRLWRKHENHGG